MAKKILFVDDEHEICKVMKIRLYPKSMSLPWSLR